MFPSSDLLQQVCAGQSRIFKAGDFGALWRVTDGLVRLDSESGLQRLPVQLALPGDLLGIESLCDLPYQFTATAFNDCQLEPVRVKDEVHRKALLRQALLQQQDRSHDMATLRTGSVAQRVAHLLRLLGLPWQGLVPMASAQGDEMRRQLPSLRELAQVVDAKHETVCRALGQLLPPRSRKSGPVHLAGRRPASAAWVRPAWAGMEALAP